MRRALLWSWLPGCLLFWTACGTEDPAINRVGVNVVEKAIFQDSWYMSRTVVDVDYEGSALGTFPGDIASDAAMDFTALPRIRWVIDEDSLYAYRDYELVRGGDGESKADRSVDSAKPADSLPVAAYKIEKHFDIRRAYNASTGEERNVIEENDKDRPWYAREYMRVDWSKNLLPGYFGQTQDLNELLGNWKREPTDLYVQDASKFPASYHPQFQRMRCKNATDSDCPEQERDFAADYGKDELYHMSFVSQEVLSPGRVPDAVTGEPVNWCAEKLYSDAPACSSLVSYVRTSFLKVSHKRQYEPLNYVDSRFDRFGFFRLTSAIDDRSTGAPDDPAFGITDFRNYNVNRHNIWMKWRDDDGHSIPYADRSVRKVVWYTTPELPAHLVQPSFDLVGRWNEVFMSTVRRLRGQALPSYPDVSCQKENPDGYCFCEYDPDSNQLLNPTCRGQYDPFKAPKDYGEATKDAYDCWVSVPDEVSKIDMDDGALSDKDFNPWFKARFTGSECVTILRANTCNKASLAAQTDKSAPLACEDRGDLRYKFLSYVSTPGTGFLGIATLRGDPETGEIIAGDANIGGPALDSYRTSALQTYDLIKGNLTDLQLQVGEDIRGYFENLGRVSLPARPRSEFNVASRALPESLRAEIDDRMQSASHKLERLKGSNGRQAVMSDRKQKLIGSDLERRLIAGLDAQTENGAGAAGVSTGALTDQQLDQVSPLRTSIQKRLDDQREREDRYSRANVTLPNEYTDDSVQWFVSRHPDWPRARLEIEINRLLYRETELHELGHCMGMRHDFGASADSNNYRDEYYAIARRYPLPDQASFDKDGTAGLSRDETLAFDQAYDDMRAKREKAGIDGAMNSSVMEYTANWYERLQLLGKYDSAAIAFAYGDLVEAYDGTPTGGDSPRTMLRYYQGGETCTTDAQCPYSKQGEHAADLLATNMSSGITQRCIDNPRTTGAKLCSSSDEDLEAHAANNGRLHPLTYRFCTDERADATLGWCSRFDEGDTYRDIVRNIEESYDRMYLFSAFRRYRSDFSSSTYSDALLGRRLNILQNVYQNMLYEYLNDPAFRKQEGAFGFYDQFLATTDILNFYARILAQPNVGGYLFNDQTGTYERAFTNSNAPAADLGIPLGLGRYFYSDYQSGLSGIERLERIGSFYDKARVIELLASRGSSSSYTPDLAFYANFYDLFPNEMQQIFTGMIRGYPQAYMPRVVCDSKSGTKCQKPRLVYLDFYRGDCSKPETCRPNPESTYSGLPILDGGGSITLQVYAAIYGLSDFPVYFDTTFQSQLFVCIEGQADCYQPEQTAVEGKDYVRYTSPRYRRSFIAFQVEPSQGVAEQTSIGFAMVKEARDLDIALDALRKVNGGQKLAQADLDAVASTGYQLPTSPLEIDSELIRIENRVIDLESFFNQIIQIQRSYGILPPNPQ